MYFMKANFGLILLALFAIELYCNNIENKINSNLIDSISNCAFQIAINNFTLFPNVNIFLADGGDDSTVSLLYNSAEFGLKLNNFETFTVDFYGDYKTYSIIIFDDLRTLLLREKGIKKLLLWNSRSKYIFIVNNNSETNVEEASDLLWKYYLINVIILIPNKEDENITDIYSWFPYENGLCGHDTNCRLISKCRNGIIEKDIDFFPQKIPETYNGCIIRAQVIIAPPYVMYPDDGIVENNKVLKITQGTEVQLVKTIAQLLNLTLLIYSSTVPNDWGLATPDGNTSGTIKVLYEKRAELGFGSYGPTAERRMFCDHSASHTFESITWCVPRAQLAPRWRNILDTYQYNTWISMIGAYIIVSITTWIFCYCPPKDRSCFVQLKNSINYCFSLFLAISVYETPQKIAGRIMFFVWIVFGLHFVAVFQTKLISVLIHPTYGRQLDTLDEILTSNMDWASLPTLKRFYNNTDDWRVAKIINEWKTSSDALGGLTRIAYQRDFAFCVLENNARYEMLRFVNSKSKPLIYCFPSYLQYPSEIYMTKGFPIRDKIDKFIYRIKATGLMAKWKHDTEVLLLIKNRNKLPGGDETIKLTLSHLQGAFMVLGIGLGVAIVGFISEIIYALIRMKILRKKVVNKWKFYASTNNTTRAKVKTIKVRSKL